jgi:hypothetical protein
VTQDIYFTFNQPGGELLAYCVTLIWLAIPMWKTRQIKAEAGSVTGFLLSSKGWPYLCIIILEFLAISLLAFRDYRGFWTLTIVDENKIELGYWFPRPDPVVQPQDISELRLVTIHYHSKGEIVNERWSITLATRTAKAYSSVNILSKDKAKSVIVALEQLTGLHHTPYLREGMFGTPAPVAQ